MTNQPGDGSSDTTIAFTSDVAVATYEYRMFHGRDTAASHLFRDWTLTTSPIDYKDWLSGGTYTFQVRYGAASGLLCVRACHVRVMCVCVVCMLCVCGVCVCVHVQGVRACVCVYDCLCACVTVCVRHQVRAYSPGGNRDPYLIDRNSFSWQYVPALPWLLIILAFVILGLIILGIVVYIRRQRRRAALEKYALKRKRRKLKVCVCVRLWGRLCVCVCVLCALVCLPCPSA